MLCTFTKEINKSIFLIPTLFILLLLPLATYAQQRGEITGKVQDDTGNPVTEASITIEGLGLGTSTDKDGNYKINNVPIRKLYLKVSKIGYEKSGQTVNPVAESITTVDIVLKNQQTQLKEVLIAENKQYKKTSASATLRVEQPVISLPQSIIIISNEIIKEQQLLNVSEIERNVSGVTSNLPYPGIYTDFMIRGSRGETNKFRNGIQSANGTQLMEDMSFVEDVEFVKGPAGFMISQGEPGGIYNVYTKKPVRQSIREVSLGYGSFDMYRGSADFGGAVKKDGKLLYRLNAMGQKSNTQFDHDHNDRYAFAPALTYEFNVKNKITAEYNFQQAKIGITEPSIFSRGSYTALPVNFTYYDPIGKGSTITDHSVYLNFQSQLSDAWKLTAQGGYNNGRWKGNRFDFGFGPEGILDAQGNMYRSYELQDLHTKNFSGQLFVNGKVTTGSIPHELLAGLDANDYSLSNFRVSAAAPTINIYQPSYNLKESDLPSLGFEGENPYKESANYAALYVQDMLTFFNKLRITLAVRYTRANIISFEEEERKTEKIDAFTPRFGISYSIKPDFSVYGLYDQSFIPQAGTNVNGEKFKPLKGNNLEVGLKKDWFNNTISTTMAAYHITKTNKLTNDPLNSEFQIMRGEIQSKGVEFDMIGRTGKGISIVFNYAYTDSKITEDTDENVKGQRVDGVARNAANLWLKYQFQYKKLKGLGLAIGGRYLTGRAALTGLIDVSENKFPELGDWKQLDAAVSYQFKSFNISMNAFNITNRKNYTGLPVFDIYYTQYSAPANFRVLASYKF